MSDQTPRQPTGEECTSHAEIEPGRFAIWYPQMGGYWSHAVVEPDGDGCFEAWVWHNGEFPFEDYGEAPRHLHHCDAEQFVDFGKAVMEMGARLVAADEGAS